MKIPKCPVCGCNGATEPISKKKKDIGYCWQHFPSGWKPSSPKEELMTRTLKELREEMELLEILVDNNQDQYYMILDELKRRKKK